jgi:transposase-like protein
MSAGKMPRCGSAHVRKNGTAKTGRQGCLRLSENGPRRTFIRLFVISRVTRTRRIPYVRPRIFFLIINGKRNGCGTRAAARALGIARDTVASALRGSGALVWYINRDYLNAHKNVAVTVDLGMSR